MSVLECAIGDPPRVMVVSATPCYHDGCDPLVFLPDRCVFTLIENNRFIGIAKNFML